MRVYNFIKELQKTENFTIEFKNHSLLMSIICKILFFTNFKNFTTTIFRKIYFPNKQFLFTVEQALITTAHEFKHVVDMKKNIFIHAAYLLPQLLVLLLPLVFINWMFVFVILFLAPLPAYWRMKLELDAYKISLFTYNELLLERGKSQADRLFFLREQAERINKHFTGFNYYLMWPWGVEEKLNTAVDSIVSEKIIEKDDIYGVIREAIKNS